MFNYRAQGYECCKTCDNHNQLRCMFCDDYAQADIMRWYNQLKDEHGCSTCAHCEHICDYPAYVTGEECVCKAGLECDTVLFSVKNCEKWRGKYEQD